LALLAIAACKGAAPFTAPAATGAPSSAFAWVALRPASDARAEEYPAKLLRTNDSEAVVVPPLPARIVTLAVKPGDTVEKGAPIAQVLMPEVDVALAMLQGAESVLGKRRAQLATVEAEGLVRAGDVSSLELELAKQTAEKLRARAVLTGAGVTQGGTITLKSPIAGVVIEVPATQGELRRPEDGPLARIRSRTGQRIEAQLPSRPVADATYLYRTPEGLAPLTLVNQAPATNGLGYLAWFEPPPGTPLPTAAEGRVLVRASGSADAWVVPVDAVGTRGSERFLVVRAKDETASTVVTVQVARVGGGEAVVRGPLLVEGMRVAADPSAAAALASPGARP
jgi:membrane fusion protein, heavy metal efflux system